VVGQTQRGERLAVIGRTPTGDWLHVVLGNGSAWVATEFVSLQGDASVLAVETAEPPPTSAARPAVQVYEATLSIPTYPYANFTQPATNPDYGWTYRRFDRSAYEASNPQPTLQTYRVIVLENEYLKLTILPELGGRVYQAIFKPTGSNEFYQNPVLKPSPWGPPEQGGWLAAGGLEWGLPVEEHGYAWGDPWGHIILPFSSERAGVTVFMPDEGHLRAEVDIILRAGEARFSVRPRLVNPGGEVSYKFWLNAMLAPGPANTVGPGLRWLFPTSEVTVHSRGDEALPAEKQAMSWSVFGGVDYSLLGNWNRWLGFFERPSAHGPFAGVYDETVDEGLVRVFPPAATQGSKGFGLGWADPIGASNYTDDGSAYVELHGGVAPTFWDLARLAAGGVTTWEESWFPVAGIGGVSYADGSGAVNLARTAGGLLVGVFPVRPVTGQIRVTVGGQTVIDESVTLDPARPFRRELPAASLPSGGQVQVELFEDGLAQPLLSVSRAMELP